MLNLYKTAWTETIVRFTRHTFPTHGQKITAMVEKEKKPLQWSGNHMCCFHIEIHEECFRDLFLFQSCKSAQEKSSGSQETMFWFPLYIVGMDTRKSVMSVQSVTIRISVWRVNFCRKDIGIQTECTIPQSLIFKLKSAHISGILKGYRRIFCYF